jgi:hypothetical protein
MKKKKGRKFLREVVADETRLKLRRSLKNLCTKKAKKSRHQMF